MFSPYYQQIIRVNGENGARALQMQPNSSALLLDETAPLVWLAQTDGAGYKSVKAFKIEPYEVEHTNVSQTDLEAILSRLDALESAIKEGKQNAKPDSQSNHEIK